MPSLSPRLGYSEKHWQKAVRFVAKDRLTKPDPSAYDLYLLAESYHQPHEKLMRLITQKARAIAAADK